MNAKELEKYMAGDASQQEKEDVQRWIETDEANRKEFAALRTLYDISLAHLPEEQRSLPAPERKNNRKFSAEWLKIAAAILITFACSYYFLKPSQVEGEGATMQTLHIPAGQRAELTLVDGTKVWLNALTTFTFPNRFTATSREVYLDGEAYFEVSRDAAKPFAVHTKPYEIRVLGTEFNVSAYQNKNGRFETSLIKGSVEIISPDHTQTVKLSPGDHAYEKDNRLVTGAIPDYNRFLWKKGIICFENERIEDILTQLQLYYDIEIRNDNASVKDMRYTGKFRTKDGIEHVLNVLKIPTGLHYNKDNEANIIQIK
jgi:ferric-dicitrate binding protein FerR (iron transport regulator)